ncbi:VC0807 family protein [Streptomyces sp. NPDC003697]
MTTNRAPQGKDSRPGMRRNLQPLLLDVALPLGAYYLLREGLGTSAFAALAWSSVAPAVRTGWAAVRQRTTNGLALLILIVNVVGLLLGFVSGDPRLMLLKDSAISSTVGIGILVSVALGKPMMTAGMKPFLVKGDAVREAAWERLKRDSAAFRRAERVFSLVWGVVLLGECVVRGVGAYTVPVDTMVGLGSVVMVATMVFGFLLSGALAVGPMKGMLAAETKGAGTGEPELALAR